MNNSSNFSWKNVTFVVTLSAFAIGAISYLYSLNNDQTVLGTFDNQNLAAVITRPPANPTYNPDPKPFPLPTAACTRKEGINNFSVNTNCKGNGFKYASVTCYDGYTQKLGGFFSCKTSPAWKAEAEKICKGHFNNCPSVTPTPTSDKVCTPGLLGTCGRCPDGSTCYKERDQYCNVNTTCQPIPTKEPSAPGCISEQLYSACNSMEAFYNSDCIGVAVERGKTKTTSCLKARTIQTYTPNTYRPQAKDKFCTYFQKVYNSGCLISNLTPTPTPQYGCHPTDCGQANCPVICVEPPISKKPTPTPTAFIIGGQKDEHGCLVAAGMSWCQSLNKCIQPWMEKCPTSPTRKPTTSFWTTPRLTPINSN